MAKETMQAVNEAEKSAHQTVAHAKEESERLLADAQAQGKKLIADAEKEAKKRADVLCGVARADAEKQKARSAKETEEEQACLKETAAASLLRVEEEIKKIVLGQSERR